MPKDVGIVLAVRNGNARTIFANDGQIFQRQLRPASRVGEKLSQEPEAWLGARASC